MKWFNYLKGYGFILPDDGGKDVFLNVSELRRAGLQGLLDGQKVAYEVQEVRGKNAAVSIKTEHE